MSGLEVIALVFGVAVLALALAAKPVEALLGRLGSRRRAARRQRRREAEARRAEQVRNARLAQVRMLEAQRTDINP